MNKLPAVAATGLLVLLCRCCHGVAAFSPVQTTTTTGSCALLGSSTQIDVGTTDDSSTTKTRDPLLIRAAKGQKTERTPVWMMRQAGRHIAEYRDLCKQYPTFRQRSEIAEVAVEVSLQPWRNYQTDGCILFSDILTPLPGIGADFVIDEKVGPIMTTPIRTYEGLKQVRIQLMGCRTRACKLRFSLGLFFCFYKTIDALIPLFKTIDTLIPSFNTIDTLISPFLLEK